METKLGRPIRDTIGGRIRRLRVARDIQQEELAEAIGVSPSTLCRWELHDTPMNCDDLKRIATALECDPAYLLVGSEEATASQATFYSGREVIPTGLLEAYNALNAEGYRITVAELLRVLKLFPPQSAAPGGVDEWRSRLIANRL